MRIKLLLLIAVFISAATISNAQVTYKDQLIDNTVFSNAPDEIKNSKPFIREWKFYEERMYPNSFFTTADPYGNAIRQRDLLRQQNQNSPENVTWVSLGPTSGYYFNWGNISSRIITGAYHPANPDIIYIGPANGGVWKSVDGGINWTPLTDNAASMSMGAIAIDPANPEIVYAGTGEATYSIVSYYGRGLLKTTNGGSTWTHITTGLPSSSYFSRLAVRPGHSNELVAALGINGLYRSTDAGMTWTALNSSRTDDVVFSPSGDTCFALGSGIGLMRSVDGGATFAAFGAGLPGSSRAQFDLYKQNPAIMYAAIYAGSTVKAYKSTNYGQNWAQVASTYDFGGGQAWYDLYCRVSPSNSDICFIGTIEIHRTTNGGTSFQDISQGYGNGNVHVDQHYMFFHPSDPATLIACNDGGIYKSTNNGNSFINLNQTLTLTQFYRIAASPFTPARILGGTQDNGTQQTYSSLNWAAAFGGDGGEVCFNPFDENYIIGEAQNGYLSRTTNGGASWSWNQTGINQSENVAWVAPIIHHPSINGTFYIARQRVYKSTNNGGSWTAISPNVNSTAAVRELAISQSNPSLMFATSSSKVFRSTDGGATWTNVTTGLPAKVITSVNVHPQDENIVLLTFSGFGTSKVYKSTDKGTTWVNIGAGLPDSPVNDGFIYTEDAAHPNTYFIGSDVGVFVTRDNGTTWVELPDGLPNTVIMHLDYSPSTHTLRAGTHGRGVYEAYIDYYIPVEFVSFSAFAGTDHVLLSWTTATETNNKGFEIERKLKNQDWEKVGFVSGNGTVSGNQNYTYMDNLKSMLYEGRILYRLRQVDFDGTYKYSKTVYADINLMPKEFVLYQNYPNPFNPATTIAYSIPSDSRVSIKIFNSVGQEVETLIDKNHTPGLYELTWDATGKAAGVYFYTIEASGMNGSKSFKETKKVLLVK